MMRRTLALLLCVTMLFPFNLSSALAEPSYTAERVVFDDLMDELQTANNVTLSTTWRDWVKSVWDDPNYLVTVVIDSFNHFSITTWNTSYTANYWCMQDDSPYGFKYIHDYVNSNNVTVHEVQNPSTKNIQFKGSSYSRVSSSVMNDVYSGYVWSFAVNFDVTSVPSGSRYQLAGAINVANMVNELMSDWRIYYSKDIYSLGSYDAPRYERNLFKEDWVSDMELVTFMLGERRYLTIKDQSLVRQIDPDLYGYEWLVAIGSDDASQHWISFVDISLLPNASQFINAQLQNISPLGIYALDVTSWGDVTVYLSRLYDGEYYYYDAVNLPLNLFSDGGESNSYTQAWSEMITYINNYNLDPVIPQPLLDQFFGSDTVTTTRVQVFGIDRWWHTGNPLIPPNNVTDVPFWCSIDGGQGNLQGGSIWNLVDFSLLEIAIIPVEMNLSYSFDTYWYETNGDTNIGDYTFEELFSMFDGVIVVPDQAANTGFLYENYDVSIDGQIRYNDPLCRCNVDFRLDYEEYLENAYANGYLFLNSKAIQKAQLLYFCNGFSSYYKLMSDYIQSEYDWKASFLTFTTALYYYMDSLGGTLTTLSDNFSQYMSDFWGFKINVEDYLNRLNNNIQIIIDKLTQLVDNTDEQVHNFWILPVYNFIRQFESSPLGFVNWVDSIEDLGDNAPPLPVVSVPALPTMGVYLND